MEQPLIDWDTTIKLAGNNRQDAEEFLMLFAKELSDELTQLKKSFEMNDFKKMKDQLHRLLGAMSYCSVPRLHDASKNLNQELKKNNDILKLLEKFTKFENEVMKLRDYFTSS